MAVEMLYLLTMAVWGDTATRLVHYGFGLLAVLGIFALGRRLRNPAVGFCAAALWLMGPHKEKTVDYFAFANVDLALAAALVCAVLSWLHWQKSRSHRWLVCAALCAGFALTVKLTAAFIGFGLVVVTIYELICDRNGHRRQLAVSPAGSQHPDSVPAVSVGTCPVLVH